MKDVYKRQMLDSHVKNDIAKTIHDAAQKTNTAILLVTHDITLAESICDTIAVMHDGKIIEQGETLHILHSPQNAYTKRLIAADVYKRQIVVNSLWSEIIALFPVCMSKKQPVPYVFLAHPLSKQHWPNKAAC